MVKRLYLFKISIYLFLPFSSYCTTSDLRIKKWERPESHSHLTLRYLEATPPQLAQHPSMGSYAEDRMR